MKIVKAVKQMKNYSKFISSLTQHILVIDIKKLKIRRHVSAHWAIIRPKP